MQIVKIPASRLDEYASISIGFLVQSRLDVHLIDAGLGGLHLVKVPVEPEYFKDYDGLEPEGSPIFWPKQFDVSNWGFFLAQDRDVPVGAAAVAFHTAGVNMLEGRSDLAVLWDIRVSPQVRGQGIGAGLFKYAVEWARVRGARQLKIETQNNNVPACRFYASQGCQLGLVHCYAYAGVPACEDEIMLCWYYDLK